MAKEEAMNLLLVILLHTVYECKGDTSGADSINFTKLIDAETTSGRQAGYGLIKFEGQSEHESDHNGLVTFNEDGHSNRPLKFEELGTPSALQNQVKPNSIGEQSQNVVFQDDNSQQNMGQKKRRKRRRKSRRYFNPLVQGAPKLPGKASVPMPPGPLRTLSDAFNSIVANDDKKCVNRMLCEQAATGVITVNSNIAKTITTILQYLPVMQKMIYYSAYPLFTAVGTLAMAMNAGQTSKNESICQKKYPGCPSDPEERLYYFNNHKGGLSRFFRGETQHQYTAQEFHNNLLSMGLTPHPYLHGQHSFPTIAPTAFKYGVLRPSLHLGNGVQQPYAYGLQQPGNQYGTQMQNFQSLPPNKRPFRVNNGNYAGYVNPSQASYTNYGAAYPYHRRFNPNEDTFRSNANQTDNSENEIQKRIQNKPEVFADENSEDATSYKWSFPRLETTILKFDSYQNTERNGRQVKFPDNKMKVEQNSVEQVEGFSFPGAQSNRQYLQIGDEGDILADDDFTIGSTGYESGGFKNTVNGDEEGIETVYVVRGNGDPRRPEIIKLRPGEKIQ